MPDKYYTLEEFNKRISDRLKPRKPSRFRRLTRRLPRLGRR